jgi:aarF domain-containing kinase
LRLEAQHLIRFRENFKNWPKVVFPKPIMPLNVSSALLVETYEEGEPVNPYLHTKTDINSEIASIGLNAYMKMMLIDNYIHAGTIFIVCNLLKRLDLHPGNILVRRNGDQVQLVILDVGLITELSQTDASHFVELFKDIVKGDGRHGTELMIKYAR